MVSVIKKKLFSDGAFIKDFAQYETCLTCSLQAHQRTFRTMFFNFVSALDLDAEEDTLLSSGTEETVVSSNFKIFPFRIRRIRSFKLWNNTPSYSF